MGWIKVLGFTTLIYKMGLLTGGISIVVDRNSLFNRSTQPTELAYHVDAVVFEHILHLIHIVGMTVGIRGLHCVESRTS